jgi:hypothetical protein
MHPISREVRRLDNLLKAYERAQRAFARLPKPSQVAIIFRWGSVSAWCDDKLYKRKVKNELRQIEKLLTVKEITET